MIGDWHGWGLWEGSAGAHLQGASGGNDAGGAGGGYGPPRSYPPSTSFGSESVERKEVPCSHDNITAVQCEALCSPSPCQASEILWRTELSDSWKGEGMLKVIKDDKGRNKHLTDHKRVKI